MYEEKDLSRMLKYICGYKPCSSWCPFYGMECYSHKSLDKDLLVKSFLDKMVKDKVFRESTMKFGGDLYLKYAKTRIKYE